MPVQLLECTIDMLFRRLKEVVMGESELEEGVTSAWWRK